MPFIHNSRLKAWINDLLGNNAADGQSMQIADYVVHPVVVAQPYIEIVRTATANATLYTTPTDKYFFLTNIHMNVQGEQGGAGVFAINFNLADGTVIKHILAAASGTSEGSSNTQDMQFPMQGIKLAKGTAITSSDLADGGNIMIMGYLGDDRN